ncbi:tRNA uridine-5-carboxymethylaminomethyl(34) synthesis GTPase MnmE [Alicyclobacillus herbarius]|uniref:tRNA uridine-5-carboxymethylaminomethyl(34) synthesis GTPase MnmE n=1 Tax=Alicyclobacillus herbarius TaxID=122960 RepID=UPI00040BF290|nr:tRNA uridine-5-carboxymethylaminomethyl(34) synthesis GTPase MnmE [Alicyclobacillus herbarius]
MELDTIAAVATAPGESAVGIVRVSGKGAKGIAEKVVRTPAGRQPTLGARKLLYGRVVHPESGETVDEAIILWMPGPKSYTAEDVLELQVHGGLRVVQTVLGCVLDAGARLAEPGEFTRRAFVNGRIDLSQAEAVMDLIRAKTERATQSALEQVRGRLGDKVRELRQKLLRLQAHVEVTIDYPEHDVEDVASAQVVETGRELLADLDELLAAARTGQVLRDGLATAIVGRPNVGKSSLMNALLQRDRAIVTDIPGTTRDVLEEYVNMRGIPFRLLDTAGIRETGDVVERMGVKRSRQMLQEAELVLLVLDASRPLSPEDVQLLRDTEGLRRIIVLNKADLPRVVDEEELTPYTGGSTVVQVSARELQGMAELADTMATVAGFGSGQDLTYMANERQRRLLESARRELAEAVAAAEMGATLDIVAVQLQSAYAELGLVIGEEVGEELLDEIFSQFCLGK